MVAPFFEKNFDTGGWAARPGIVTAARRKGARAREGYRMPDTTEVFQYLDELRESGEVNMFGSAAYVQEKFGIGRKDAQSMVNEWMQQFSV